MPYIGIDFGTSNSVVANFQYGQAEVIPNHEGQKWTPSIVTMRRDGTLGFGQEAVFGAALTLGLVITVYKVAMFWATRRPIARPRRRTQGGRRSRRRPAGRLPPPPGALRPSGSRGP